MRLHCLVGKHAPELESRLFCHKAYREKPEYSHYMVLLFIIWFMYIYQQQLLFGNAVFQQTQQERTQKAKSTC